MTLLHPALHPGLRWTRLKRRPELAVAITGAIACCVQLVAGRPGWMLPATVGQWAQARSGPYSDAYPAVLTWFWAQMDPAGRGPLVPFLLQVFLFWLGVVLITVGMQPGPRWTRFIPLLVLLNPLTWVVAVVAPPSAMLAVITVALGVASIGLRRFRAGRPTDGTVALLVASVVMGFGALGGGGLSLFVVPLLMLLTAATALAVLPSHLGGRARLETGAKAVLLTGVASLVAGVAMPLIVIGNVAPTRAEEAFYALDAFHVDCAPTWSTGRIAEEPVSPPGLWRDAAAPCSTGAPGDFGDAWAGAADPSSAAVLDFASWTGIVAAHPAIVIGGRLQHATAMLVEDYPLLPAASGGELAAAPAAVGAGEAAGQPSHGGLVLSMVAAIAALLPGAPLLGTLLLPVAAAIWWVRRQRRSPVPGRAAMLPLVLWPPLAGLVLGMATPFSDATVLAATSVLGTLAALWTVAMADVSVRARDVESKRYGGPYPGTLEPAPAKRTRRPRRPRKTASDIGTPSQPDFGPSPLSSYIAEHPADFEAGRGEPADRVPSA